jgi:hypothetical protein
MGMKVVPSGWVWPAIAALAAALPGTGQQPAAMTPAAPPVFAKRMYHAPGGQIYAPAGVPIRMNVGLSAGDPGQDGAQDSENSSVVVKEGPNSLEFGGARISVIGDGTPPRVVLDVLDTTNVTNSGVRVLAPKPKLRITVTDTVSGVAQSLISLDGAAFVPLPESGPQVQEDGLHHLRYFAVDHVGNVSPMQEYTFRIDGTPPVTTMAIAGPRADSTVGVGGSLALSATDDFAGVDEIRYRLDGGPEQHYERPFQFDEMPEGKHRLEYYARDMVSNKEAGREFQFIVDRQPPQLSLSIHGAVQADKGVRYVAPDAEIELGVRDAVAGTVPATYRVDGGEATVYKGPFHLPGTSGIHRIVVNSEDPVHNASELSVDDIYVDLTAPATEVEFSRPFFVQDGTTVLNPQSMIALNTSDLDSGVAAVKYTIDGGVEQTYQKPFSVALLGEHRLSMTSVDRVGNAEAPHEVRIRIEPQTNGGGLPSVLDEKRWYQHPKLGLIGPEGLPFVLRISDSPDAGAENYLISAGPEKNPGPLAYPVAGKEKITVAISKKPQSFGVSIDNAPPKTELAATGAHRVEAGGVTYFGPGLKIALTSADDPAGISSGVWKTLYSLDGTPFTRYTAPLISFSREGAYSLRYYALDNVGNAEAVHTLNFTVDTSAPKTHIELLGPHHGDTIAPSTRIALLATDNLSGVTQLQWRLDEGKETAYSQPLAINALHDGAHRLRYYAVDAAGNRETEHLWAFTVVGEVSPVTYEIRGHSIERGGSIYVTPGSSIVLKATGSDAVQYAIDGGTTLTYDKPIPVPDGGSHRLSFHAVDGLSNQSSARTLNLVVDRTPPGSHVRFEGPQLQHDGTLLIGASTRIILNGDAEAVGASSVEYSLDGRRWQPYTAPFTIHNSGTYEVHYRAHNALSLTEPAQAQKVIVDALGPVVAISYSTPVDNAGDTVAIDPETLIYVSAEDAPAGLEKITCKVDDQPERVYRTPLARFSPGKVHTVTIAADDLVGNRTVKTIHVRVKEPKP